MYNNWGQTSEIFYNCILLTIMYSDIIIRGHQTNTMTIDYKKKILLPKPNQYQNVIISIVEYTQM